MHYYVLHFFCIFANMESKKEKVRGMFNSIAQRYDLLNHTLSLGIDRRWRARVVRMVVAQSKADHVLDVATGTGDLAIGLIRGGVKRVTGADLSSEMVAVGVRKIASRKLSDLITMEVQDVEQLNYENDSFDAVTCAFGVRNFENLELGLTQMHRVLSKHGGIYILEFSKTGSNLWGWIYNFYFHNILPFVGRVVSGNRQAYSYLPESVDDFASGDRFLEILSSVGFSSAKKHELMGGIATIYTAIK